MPHYSAWASQKSVRRKDGSGDCTLGGFGLNASCNFLGEKRSNKTYAINAWHCWWIGKYSTGKTAGLSACVDGIDCRHAGGLGELRMASLIALGRVRQSLDLCLTGPTGCGKTWLSCAFSNQACRWGFSVRYLRLPRLVEMQRIDHGERPYNPATLNYLPLHPRFNAAKYPIVTNYI